MDEVFWNQKEKVKWNLEGDRNTTFFNKMEKIKSSRSIVTYLRNGIDVIKDPTEMENHVVKYFTDIFCFVLQILFKDMGRLKRSFLSWWIQI